MNVLIHTNYFPEISQLKLIIDSKKLIFEINDNFQKQTHRNRTYIYGANGLLLLSIPVIHSQKNRKKFKDVKIAYDYDWLTQHLKSFQISYRSSPFFEYYEDKLVDLYVRREKYLYDFNLRSIDVLFDMLQINLEYDFTKGYSEQYSDILDYRNNYKKLNSSFKIKEYTQVFESKHGYIENLSALDLIFNEGPNAINFLKTS